MYKLGLYGTRPKGSRTFEWNKVKGVRSGLQDNADSYVKGVEMLMKNEWFEKLGDCKCVSLRLCHKVQI